MNNFTVLWDYTKFNSKEEAKKYCLSKKCQENISYLDGLAESLIEKSQTETPVQAGHGYPLEAPSSLEASYVSQEANRLRQLRKYFKGEPANPGYKWKYDTHGLNSVYQELDLDNATPKHPVFLEYIKDNHVKKHKVQEVFDFWLDCHLNPSLNKTFKLAYKFKMDNLIPDGLKLFELTTKKKS